MANNSSSANDKLLREVISKLLSEHTLAVEDLRNEKNRSLSSIESYLNAQILHQKGLEEWAHQFAEELDKLQAHVQRLEAAHIDGLQQINAVIVRIEEKIGSELAIRRLLTEIVSGIHEKLFDERYANQSTEESEDQ